MKSIQEEGSRRKFLLSLAGVSSSMLLRPSSLWAMDEIDPRVAKIVANTMAIDTHSHIDVRIYVDQPLPTYDFVADFKKSGLSALCMTFAVDYQKLQNPGDAYDRFINGLDATDRLLQEVNLKRSLNLADLTSAFKNKKPAVIQSVEGGHFLEGQIDRLKTAYDRGLRVLGLLHDNHASIPLGDIYTKTAEYGGLTPFGAQVIKECNHLGILIDLTHCDNKTIDDALKISTKPIMVSHTGLDTQLGLNAKLAQMMKPRLINKQQAKIVANAGGLIGVWKHLTNSPLEYAEDIRAMVDVVGVDHVCLGTDSKITRAIKPNEPPTPPRVGEYSNGIWEHQETGFFYAVVDAMLKTGFSEGDIVKISSSNFCRVFDAAVK